MFGKDYPGMNNANVCPARSPPIHPAVGSPTAARAEGKMHLNPLVCKKICRNLGSRGERPQALPLYLSTKYVSRRPVSGGALAVSSRARLVKKQARGAGFRGWSHCRNITSARGKYLAWQSILASKSLPRIDSSSPIAMSLPRSR